MRILILDDDRSYGALLASASKKLGHRAIVKVDAQEAVQMLRNREADIALVDLEMPNGSGTAFAKTLKQNGITVPVAFCTGTCRDVQLIEEAATMGQVLPKIWTHADLREILNTLQLQSSSIERLRETEAANNEITEPAEERGAPPQASGSNEQQRRRIVMPVSSQEIARLDSGEVRGLPQRLPDSPHGGTLPPSAQMVGPGPTHDAGAMPPPLAQAPEHLDDPPPLQLIESPPSEVGEAPPLSLGDPYAEPPPAQLTPNPVAPLQPADPFQGSATSPKAELDTPQPKKLLDAMLEVGDAMRETPRVNIGCSNWGQVRRLCDDVTRGMTTITVRARCEMRAGEDVVVALELPDEMVVSIGARVMDFREKSSDGKRPYQLDLVGFGEQEIQYLLSECALNMAPTPNPDATPIPERVEVPLPDPPTAQDALPEPRTTQPARQKPRSTQSGLPVPPPAALVPASPMDSLPSPYAAAPAPAFAPPPAPAFAPPPAPAFAPPPAPAFEPPPAPAFEPPPAAAFMPPPAPAFEPPPAAAFAPPAPAFEPPPAAAFAPPAPAFEPPPRSARTMSAVPEPEPAPARQPAMAAAVPEEGEPGKERMPAIPDAIDAVDSEVSYEDKGPSISWS